MDLEGNASRKRAHLEGEESETRAEIGANVEGSEEMELQISNILQKMDQFTHLVSELLDSGKAMFKELINEFEERTITVHKEQIEKWQEEIKQLRSLDASNEEANALLHNARYVLQNARAD